MCKEYYTNYIAHFNSSCFDPCSNQIYQYKTIYYYVYQYKLIFDKIGKIWERMRKREKQGRKMKEGKEKNKITFPIN